MNNLQCRGVETLVEASRSGERQAFPTSSIALSLIAGFTFMLVVERQFSHAGSQETATEGQYTKPSDVSSVEFDVELGELEQEEGFGQGLSSSHCAPTSSLAHAAGAASEATETRQRAYPLTLGLVVHALADGLALGSAALSDAGSQAAGGESVVPSGLSVVVFLALVIHKGEQTFCSRW